MTSNPIELIGCLLVGGLAGGAFFGGLWLTVRQLSGAKHPALLMAGSALLRMSVVVGVVFLFGRGHFERMLAILAGVILARFLVLRLTRSKPSREDHPCA